MKILKYLLFINFNLTLAENNKANNMKNNSELITEKKYIEILNKIKKSLKKEFKKYYYTKEYGFNIYKLEKVKIGDFKKKVHKQLGKPYILNNNPNVEYYSTQKINIIFGSKFFANGYIVRIEYKDGQIIKIKKINMKKSKTKINTIKILMEYDKKISKIKLS